MTRRSIQAVLLLLALLTVASCGSKFHSYRGPEVTRIIVLKGQRQLFLMHDQTVLKAFPIALGFAPEGRKEFEGDGRTPEGSYLIDRRNPQSLFHLSLGISYPNAADVQAARDAGREPGGDIMIHGGRRRADSKAADWTYGCISVSNRQIEDIYAMVRDGTRIDIYP